MASTSQRRSLGEAAYEEVARIGKAIAHPRRLTLLGLLGQGPRTVEALAGEARLGVASVSQHLQVLRAARLVDAERRGLYVEYRLAGDDVGRFFVSLEQLAHARLSEVEQLKRDYLRDREALEPVHGEELVRRVRAGAVTVLDVRPAEEYRAGHIPGAVSIPLAELEARLRELPKSREVVAYCRGPYCVMAVAAVELLHKHGYRALRLEQGVLQWRKRGYRIDAVAKQRSHERSEQRARAPRTANGEPR